MAYAGMSAMIFVHLLRRLKDTYGLRPLPVSETHPTPLDRIRALHASLGKRSSISTKAIDDMLAISEQLFRAFPYLLKGHEVNRPDLEILTFYGSIYLPSYTQRIKEDRIDF
jgi:hypothetical protein